MNQINEFQTRIDNFLQILLNSSSPKNYSSKIIHDAVWGTNAFYSWEVALIDSPLLQRLRRIHQTGLAFLVYPCATHTRFEHSLGVTILVHKLITHLNQNNEKEIIKFRDRCYLRLAALLHDVGHSFFSHVSELAYERYCEFQDLKYEINKKFGVAPKGHEIMSFLIVRSKIFHKHFNQIINPITEIKNSNKKKFLFKIDWEEISYYIIGYSKNSKRKYLADIINGPIDCDKLDYLCRDAKFAGPVIAYDIDRYLYTITTIDIGEKKKTKRLTVTLAGINVIEQIVISKMMMFSYVYHHPKIRAAEALIKRLCFDIKKETESSCKTAIKLEHPTDYLYYTDENILNSSFSFYTNSPPVKKIIKSLINRNLWVRAQLISCFNTDMEQLPTDILQLERDLHRDVNIKKLKLIKEKIIKHILDIEPESDISIHDIWIDIPYPPSADEAKQIEVKKKIHLNESIQLSNIFPLEQWIDAYKRSKLKGHVFCDKKYQKRVYEASCAVFKDIFEYTTQDFTKDFIKIE